MGLSIAICDFSKLRGDKGAMRVMLVVLLLTTSACGYRQPDHGSSVTVTLPPPKPAVAPGFSAPLAQSVR
jgi:hypothetical protein